MFEVVLIFVLILANGFFSGSEIAVVSARKGRLQQRADEGSRGAQSALRILENPNRFLSTVQVGITLISTLAAAFGGASIAALLEEFLRGVAPLAPYAQPISLAIVVILLSYFTLILGELVPKRLALQNAEGFASFVAPIMSGLARFTAPVVSFLTASTEAVLWLLRRNNAAEAPINEDDVIALVREAVAEGTLEESEHELISNVFSFTDRSVASLMTPRTQIDAVSVDAPITEALDLFIKSHHSRIPVYEGSSDHIVGVVFAEDLLLHWGKADGVDLRTITRPPVFVLETQRGIDVLRRFKADHSTIAVVVDEYGQVAGVITQGDLLDEVVGDLGPQASADQMLLRRDDGSYLVDGLMPLADLLDNVPLPGVDELEREVHFETGAGLVLAIMGHIPETGETARWQGYEFEVVDMDGQRIDKFILRPPTPTGASQTESVLATRGMRPTFGNQHEGGDQ